MYLKKILSLFFAIFLGNFSAFGQMQLTGPKELIYSKDHDKYIFNPKSRRLNIPLGIDPNEDVSFKELSSVTIGKSKLLEQCFSENSTSLNIPSAEGKLCHECNNCSDGPISNLIKDIPFFEDSEYIKNSLSRYMRLLEDTSIKFLRTNKKIVNSFNYLSIDDGDNYDSLDSNKKILIAEVNRLHENSRYLASIDPVIELAEKIKSGQKNKFTDFLVHALNTGIIKPKELKEYLDSSVNRAKGGLLDSRKMRSMSAHYALKKIFSHPEFVGKVPSELEKYISNHDNIQVKTEKAYIDYFNALSPQLFLTPNKDELGAKEITTSPFAEKVRVLVSSLKSIKNDILSTDRMLGTEYPQGSKTPLYKNLAFIHPDNNQKKIHIVKDGSKKVSESIGKYLGNFSHLDLWRSLRERTKNYVNGLDEKSLKGRKRVELIGKMNFVLQNLTSKDIKKRKKAKAILEKLKSSSLAKLVSRKDFKRDLNNFIGRNDYNGNKIKHFDSKELREIVLEKNPEFRVIDCYVQSIRGPVLSYFNQEKENKRKLVTWGSIGASATAGLILAPVTGGLSLAASTAINAGVGLAIGGGATLYDAKVTSDKAKHARALYNAGVKSFSEVKNDLYSDNNLRSKTAIWLGVDLASELAGARVGKLLTNGKKVKEIVARLKKQGLDISQIGPNSKKIDTLTKDIVDDVKELANRTKDVAIKKLAAELEKRYLLELTTSKKLRDLWKSIASDSDSIVNTELVKIVSNARSLDKWITNNIGEGHSINIQKIHDAIKKNNGYGKDLAKLADELIKNKSLSFEEKSKLLENLGNLMGKSHGLPGLNPAIAALKSNDKGLIEGYQYMVSRMNEYPINWSWDKKISKYVDEMETRGSIRNERERREFIDCMTSIRGIALMDYNQGNKLYACN